MWTVVRYTRPRRSCNIPTLRTPDGGLAETNHDKAAELAKISFSRLEDYENGKGSPGTGGESMALLENDDSFVDRAINGQKNKKAPGIDGLGAPILKLMCVNLDH